MTKLIDESDYNKVNYLFSHGVENKVDPRKATKFDMNDPDVALFLATHTIPSSVSFNKESLKAWRADWDMFDCGKAGKDKVCLNVSKVRLRKDELNTSGYRISWLRQDFPDESKEIPTPPENLSPEEKVMWLYETHKLIVHKTFFNTNKSKTKPVNKSVAELKEQLKAMPIEEKTQVLEYLRKSIAATLRNKSEDLAFPVQLTDTLEQLLKHFPKDFTQSSKISLELFEQLSLIGSGVYTFYLEHQFDGEQDLGEDIEYTGDYCSLADLAEKDKVVDTKFYLRDKTCASRILQMPVQEFEKRYNPRYLKITRAGIHKLILDSFKKLSSEQMHSLEDFLDNIDNYKPYWVQKKSKDYFPNYTAVVLDIYINLGFIIAPATLEYMMKQKHRITRPLEGLLQKCFSNI